MESIWLPQRDNARLLGESPIRQSATGGLVQITVIREIPAYAGFYAGYETTKRSFAKRLNTTSLPVWALLCSGATGGVCYWLACYPLDVVKSRIQLAQAPPSKGGWLSGGYVTRELGAVLRESGPRGLFAGLGPSLLRAVPAAASTFLGFELTRGEISVRNKRELELTARLPHRA